MSVRRALHDSGGTGCSKVAFAAVARLALRKRHGHAFFLIFFSKVAFAAVARLALRKRHGHAFIMC
jgi:hypothetical protein